MNLTFVLNVVELRLLLVHLDTIVNLSCLMCGHQKSLFIFRCVGKFYQCE